MSNLRHKYLQNIFNFFCLFSEWFIIFGLIYLNTLFASIAFQIFSIFIIGARIHALGILMHEASHFNLFSNRLVNEWAVKLFISIPTLVSLKGYRVSHQLHHRFSQTDKDPTYTRKSGNFLFDFPKPSHWAFAKELLVILFGYGAVVALRDLTRNRKNQQSGKPFYLIFIIVTYSVFFFSLAKLQLVHLFVEFWLIPVFTVLPTINYWRTISEHSALSETSPGVRTVIYNPLISWLLTPYNINFHVEHHNQQNIKWNNLKEIYRTEKDLSTGHYTYGLINLWNEFVN